MSQTNLIEQAQAINFITAGNAVFTVKSLKTGNRFTYKAVYSDRYKSLQVKVLTGNDNNSDYSYLCHIDIEDNVPVIHKFKNGRIGITSPSFIAFEFVFYNLLFGKKIENLEIWHEGRCCRCGRMLTVPESIERGIGPECFGKTNKFKL